MLDPDGGVFQSASPTFSNRPQTRANESKF